MAIWPERPPGRDITLAMAAEWYAVPESMLRRLIQQDGLAADESGGETWLLVEECERKLRPRLVNEACG